MSQQSFYAATEGLKESIDQLDDEGAADELGAALMAAQVDVQGGGGDSDSDDSDNDIDI